MNKVYKVIWSKTRNCYVAVAEETAAGFGHLRRRGVGGAVYLPAYSRGPGGSGNLRRAGERAGERRGKLERQ